jgi:glutamate racemase
MTYTESPHIAFIDSGIGGFSIFNEVEKQIPHATFSYFMDNLYLPYGELSKQSLLNRLEKIVEFLCLQTKLDVVVIACNTASTQSLDFLRQRFEQTFVGVVPAIKPAAVISKIGRIGLLATPGTVRSPYIGQLIEEYADGCSVTRIGSSELVHLAESLFWKSNLHRHVMPSLDEFENVDTVVLGCTHFPLIKSHIQALLPKSVTLVDSGAAVAKRVESLVNRLSVNTTKQRVNYLYSTLALSSTKQLKLNEIGFEQLRHIEF